MKRAVPLLALAALVVAPAASDAAPKKPPKRVERKATMNYQGFCQVGIDGANGGVSGCPLPSEFEDSVRKTEGYLKFSVKDATGQPVGLVMYDPADYGNTAQNFCGGISKSMKVKPGRVIGIKTILDPTCGGIPTQGALTVVFSNLP